MIVVAGIININQYLLFIYLFIPVSLCSVAGPDPHGSGTFSYSIIPKENGSDPEEEPYKKGLYTCVTASPAGVRNWMNTESEEVLPQILC